MNLLISLFCCLGTINPIESWEIWGKQTSTNPCESEEQWVFVQVWDQFCVDWDAMVLHFSLFATHHNCVTTEDNFTTFFLTVGFKLR